MEFLTADFSKAMAFVRRSVSTDGGERLHKVHAYPIRQVKLNMENMYPIPEHVTQPRPGDTIHVLDFDQWVCITIVLPEVREKKHGE